LIRKHLSRITAVVLLLWVFAAGHAFAQACAATAELLCEECCPEAKSAAPVAEVRHDDLSTVSQVAPPWLLLAWIAPELALGEAAPEARPAERLPTHARARIPIVFLRLTL